MTAASAQEIYESVVRALPALERLRLARLIMDDLTDSAAAWTVDERDSWSDEDIDGLTRASLTYAVKSFGDDDEPADR